jgi:hypothetical protein
MSPSVTAMLFGSDSPTLQGYIEEGPWPAVGDYDVREAVGWIDVHTVAVGDDMAGPSV